MADRNIEINFSSNESVTPVVGRIQAALGGLSNVVTTGVGFALGSAITGAVNGLAGLGSQALQTGFDFNNLKEQANIAFTTMLGSDEKAKSFLDDLQGFAASTPFEFPDLLQNSQKLLAMGFSADSIIPTLTSVGDAVAGLGGDPQKLNQVILAMGQIKAKGKASAQEMMQLTEAGIPAWEMLAKKIGVSIPEAMKLVEKGAISADVTLGAVTEGMNANFGGMMAKQSQTFGGLMSTLKDTVTQGLGELTKPLFDVATEGLKGLVGLISGGAFQSGIKNLGTNLAGGLKSALDFIVPLFSAIFEKVKVFFGFFQSAVSMGIAPLDALRMALKNLLPPELTPMLDLVFSVLSNIAAFVTGILIPAFLAAAPQILAFAQTAFGGLINLLNGGVIPMLQQVVNWVSGVLAPALGNSFQQIIAAAIPTLQTFANWVSGVLLPALMQFGGWIQANLLPILANLAGFFVTAILPALTQLIVWIFSQGLPALGALANTLGTLLLPFIVALGGFITSQVIPALGQFAMWLQVNMPIAIQALIAVWNGVLFPALTLIWNFLTASLLPTLGQLLGIVGTALTGAVRTLTAAWNALMQLLITIIGWIRNVINTLTELANTIVSAIQPPIQAFSDLIHNLAGGLQSVAMFIKSVIEKLGELADAVKNIDLGNLLPFIGHSPAPLAIGLDSIANSLRELNPLWNQFARAPFATLPNSIGLNSSFAGATQGMTSNQTSVRIEQMTIHPQNFDEFVREFERRVGVEFALGT